MNTIQATELRIGNFIGMNLEEYPNNFFTALEIGETMKVYEGLITLKGAAIKRVETSFMYVDDFEPIPLNEDWLVKLGFTKERNSIDSADLFIKKDIVFVLTGEHYTVSWNSVTINLIPAKVKFVHELQNLFYCLTGTELTLTDK